MGFQLFRTRRNRGPLIQHMNRLLFLITLVCVSAATAAPAVEQSVLARVTVYWRAEDQNRASTGPRLRVGHCAVDPSKIPYGSTVVFPDASTVAVDTGPAVVSRTAARRAGRTPGQRNALVVDRFFETKAQASAWVARNPHFMTLKVLPPERKTRRLAPLKLPEAPPHVVRENGMAAPAM